MGQWEAGDREWEAHGITQSGKPNYIDILYNTYIPTPHSASTSLATFYSIFILIPYLPLVLSLYLVVLVWAWYYDYIFRVEAALGYKSLSFCACFGIYVACLHLWLLS